MANGGLLTDVSVRVRRFRAEGISVETVGFRRCARRRSHESIRPLPTLVLQELADQRTSSQADRQRELRQPGGAAGDGQLAERQVRGGQLPVTGSTPAATTSTPSSRAPTSSACALFGADHAYAQPHSGIDANLVAFWAVLSQRVESPALAAPRRRDM